VSCCNSYFGKCKYPIASIFVTTFPPFQNTYGWARAEVLGALVNAVFLVALCFSISVESLKRFYDPEEIHDPQMILIVGALGLLVNLLGLLLFAEHGHSHGGHGHSHGKSSKLLFF
jgi:Co/Zn/Cd efflux system component